MKSWTYEEITTAAEKTIRELLDADLAGRARGVYLGWAFLTYGWHRDSDNQNLDALTARK